MAGAVAARCGGKNEVRRILWLVNEREINKMGKRIRKLAVRGGFFV